jgi:alpha-ketoglutarate-dependent taurine dioxygenase
VRPIDSGNVDALIDHIVAHPSAIRDRVSEVGAVLFRGFETRGASDLARVAAALGTGVPLSYVGGDTPRTALRDGVYTSTEAPASVRIPLHQEMSYLPTVPRLLFFHCETPAAHGGETILADARAVYRALDPAVRDRFAERRVQYRFSYHDPSALLERVNRVKRLSKSWADAFQTDRREVAEARCHELGMNCRFSKSGRLFATSTRPATRIHPDDGAPLWFNQAHLFCWSPRWMGHLHYAAASMVFAKPGTRTHDARYGDGGVIERAALDHVHDVLDRETVRWPWECGDVLVVDNLSCMHGRSPFRGPRRVLVSMTGGVGA